MSFKLRMIMLAVFPFLLVTGAVTWISFSEMRSFSHDQIKLIQDKLRESKKHALKDYVNLALTAISPVLKNTSLDEVVAQSEVKRIINGLSYGKDGYYFVYDNQGVNLVHPIQLNLVGKNLYDKKDIHGDEVIKALLKLANTGGGFHQYYWNKPSANKDIQKLAYVVQLSRWQWMLGTGLYLDDISAEEETIRLQVDENIKRNIYTIILIVIITTLLVTLLMTLINLREGRLANRRLRGLAQRVEPYRSGNSDGRPGYTIASH